MIVFTTVYAITIRGEDLYPTIDKVKTGKRIKKLMEEKNVSAKDVRDSLALESVQSVYYWLKGEVYLQLITYMH